MESFPESKNKKYSFNANQKWLLGLSFRIQENDVEA